MTLMTSLSPSEMKKEITPDLITNIGDTDLPAYMGCDEDGVEACHKTPFREDSGEVETWDAPIDEIKDGLSSACVEALKINTDWDWNKKGFIDARKKDKK